MKPKLLKTLPVGPLISFYFVIRFETPRDYFEVNAGRVQISSMRDVSVSTQCRRTETSLS